MPLTSDSQGCPPLKYGNPGSQASEHRPSLNTRFVTQLPIFWIQVQRKKKKSILAKVQNPSSYLQPLDSGSLTAWQSLPNSHVLASRMKNPVTTPKPQQLPAF